MKPKYALITLLFLFSSQAQAQAGGNNLKQSERFCCYEWLPEFRDSIHVVLDEREINQRKRYSALIKLGGKNYDLLCWTGSPGLESPTKWRYKLKLKFRRNDSVLIKFGKEKYAYRFTELKEGEFLLVKQSNS